MVALRYTGQLRQVPLLPQACDTVGERTRATSRASNCARQRSAGHRFVEAHLMEPEKRRRREDAKRRENLKAVS
ncbi:hypothetical protein [Streptomyces noursei]|uniref:hypothetical protein n=1 Tax=Streptomyces noursei TaxID=1971 RepID=UPI0035DD8AD8